MILGRPLTAAEQRHSQRYYYLYNVFNGPSYMCAGETILILFAVQLHCSDTVVAILGGMLCFGFLLLPLGTWITGRVGAVQCQANFWVLRNITSIAAALAAPVALYVSVEAAEVLLVVAAFFFYGFRAAGIVLLQPLVGEIADTRSRGKVMSYSQVSFYGTGLPVLLVISLILKWHSSVWVIFWIMIAGAIFGFTSSGLLRNIQETGQLRDLAKRTHLKSALLVFRDKLVRRQLVAGMICNFMMILLVPISMLTLKRGYGVSDTLAMLYSLVQILGNIVVCWVLSRQLDRFGGRKVMLVSFYASGLIAVIWLAAPKTFCGALLLLPFLLAPLISVSTQTALQQYFLLSVPKRRQVSASILISIATGVVSGLAGMAVSSGLLKLAKYLLPGGTPLASYKLYFLFVLILLPVCGWLVQRLPKESEFAPQ